MSKVSICICTMNRPSKLRGCLESIGRSTLKPYEVIVSDDSQGKKAEETRKVILGFENMRYTKGPRKGLSANRNNCLRYTNSEFVVFIKNQAEYLAFRAGMNAMGVIRG